MNLLLLKSDRLAAIQLGERLRRDGFGVDCFEEGLAAYNGLKQQLYDLFILDLDSGGELTGWELLQLIRRLFPSAAILTTAEGSDEKSVLRAYHYGCSEYIKPTLYVDELLFRVRALLGHEEQILLPGGLVYLPNDHRLFGQEGEIALTGSERRLLHLLIQNRGKVVAAEVIEEVLWEEVSSEACRHTLISRVRKKLGKETIKTLPKLGYTIELPAA